MVSCSLHRNTHSLIFHTDQISFQLTGLSQPPEDDTPALFNTITQYIEGTGGTRPEWVEEGVASEVAINSIVASTWLNQTGGVRDYIIRRLGGGGGEGRGG